MQLSWGLWRRLFTSMGQPSQRLWWQSMHSALSNEYGPGKWPADALAKPMQHNHVGLCSFSVCRRACGREGSRGWGLQKRCRYFGETHTSTLSRRAIPISHLAAASNSALPICFTERLVLVAGYWLGGAGGGLAGGLGLVVVGCGAKIASVGSGRHVGGVARWWVFLRRPVDIGEENTTIYHVLCWKHSVRSCGISGVAIG